MNLEAETKKGHGSILQTIFMCYMCSDTKMHAFIVVIICGARCVAGRPLLNQHNLVNPVWSSLSTAEFIVVVCHRPAPGSTEQLVDCSGGNDISEESGFERKAVAMLGILKDQKASRTIIFCNKLTTCRKVIAVQAG